MTPPTSVALGYIRVSSEEQVAGYSLSHQESCIRQWCTQKGLTVQDVIRDEGLSGADAARPGFQDLRRRLDAGEATWVVVTRLDRLSRHFATSTACLETWAQSGVTLALVEQGQVIRPQDARLVGHMFSWIADAERQTIRARIEPGIRARVAQGLPPSRAPYGYRVIGGSRGGGRGQGAQIVVEPEEAETVRRIFHLAMTEDLGPQSITRRLGWPVNRRGMIASMLANPFYAGHLQVQLGTETLVRRENHPALISELDLQTIASRRAQRGRVQAGTANDQAASSWLGGLATCGSCGSPLTRVSVGAVARYRCQSYYRRGGGCGAPDVDAETLDMCVLNSFFSHLEAMGRDLDHIVAQELPGSVREADGLRQMAARRLDEAAQLRQDLAAELRSGRLDVPGFHAQAQLVEERVAQDRALLDRMDAWTWLTRLFGRDRAGDWHDTARKDGDLWLFQPWVSVIKQMSLSEMRRLFRTLATKISVHANGHLACTWSNDRRELAQLARGVGRAIASGGVIDQRAALRQQGWQRRKRHEDHEVWFHPDAPNILHLERPVIRLAPRAP